jgi:hypothetical protein
MKVEERARGSFISEAECKRDWEQAGAGLGDYSGRGNPSFSKN